MHTPISLRHVSFSTEDNLNLPGLLYSPEKSTHKAALFLHGNGSASVFYKPEKMLAFAQGLAAENWAFFAFNNRGAHYIKKFNYRVGEEKKERFLGTALELIDECVLDIDGAIAFLRTQGFTEFVLIGESTGANKICVYNHHYQAKDNPVSGYALIGGGDDTGLWYKMLGKEQFWNSIHLARKKIADGKGEELLSREISHGILTHQSLLDTIDPDGSYNCFPFLEASGDVRLSEKPLFHMFEEIEVPTLVLYGENDVFCSVPPAQAIEILKSHCSAPEKFAWEVTPEADHSFSEHTDAEVRAVVGWVREKVKNRTNTINASSLGKYEVENYKDPTSKALVFPLSESYPLTQQNISEIVEICNQHDVYELLFRERLNGERYQEADARSFESWANQGWRDGSYFTYCVKTTDNQVIGAIDIKSNNPENGEIGYWMHKDYPGYMTHVVKGLIQQAKKAGYHILVAYTKKENDKSKGVLLRNGFQSLGEKEIHPGVMRNTFILHLNSAELPVSP